MEKKVKLISILVVFIVAFSMFFIIPTMNSLVTASNTIGYVKYTLDLLNNTLLEGNVIIKIPKGAPTSLGAIIYDPSNGDIYFAWNGNILVINSSTNQLIKSIAVGGLPWAMAYDPQNGDIYVAEGIPSSAIIVINSSTNTIVKKIDLGSFVISFNSTVVCVNSIGSVTVEKVTFKVENITLGAGAVAILYDPENGYIYVATAFSGYYKYVNVNYNDGNSTKVAKTLGIVLSSCIYVINPTTGTIVNKINVGQEVKAMVYDPENGYIYVIDGYTNTITIINGKTNTVIGNITVGKCPSAILYEPSNGYLYVADSATNTVAVINPETNSVIKNITVRNKPVALAYDPQNGYIYVVNSGSDSVTVINGETNTVIGSIEVGLDPVSIAYDPSNGYIYVYNLGSDTISIIST